MAKRAATKPVAKRRKKNLSPEELQALVEQYEQVFDEVQHFIDLIHTQEADVAEASAAMHAAKDTYDQSKVDLTSARDARDGTKHSLFVYLKPGPSEILPLFDRMDPADEKKHGEGSKEWRKEPISALTLSLVATEVLTAADIVFVGQLQDRIQAEQPAAESGAEWWEAIEGLTAPVAAAIADRLNDFITEHSQ
jgi:hypothetical protein